jgi:adenylate cyclase
MSNGPHPHDDTLCFEEFRLDRSEGLCRRHDSGRWDPVVVGSRAVDTLRVLAERRGQLATKQALMDAVWPGIAVEDANLTMQISALRRILDEGRVGGSCIQTIIGRGYRFLPAVTTRNTSSSFADSSAAADAPVPEPRPRLSISVWPFKSLSDDRESERLAGAITDNLTTDLSGLPGARIFAQGRPGIHGARPNDVRQESLESGVNYVIQGGIRGAAVRTEVNVRLIDVETTAQIWAERFDIDRTVIADAHDEITGRLARVIYMKLLEDVNRHIEALPQQLWTSSDFVLHGRALAYRPLAAENRRDAMWCYEQALDMDPGSAEARIGISAMLITNILEGWSQSAWEDMARAEPLLIDVLRRDSDNPEAHIYMGVLRRLQGRLSDARIELEIAIALRPNNTMAIGQFGITLAFLGQPEAAIPQIEKCLRLDPRGGIVPITLAHLGLCKLLLGHIEDAIICLRKARAGNDRLYYVHMFLAAALGLRGELDEAGDALRKGLEIRPVTGTQTDLNLLLRLKSPGFVDMFQKTVHAGLLLAGLQPPVPDSATLTDEC